MLQNKRELVAALRISQRKLDDLNVRKLIPAPIRIGRSVRWRADDIALWIELGAPDRTTFEAEKERRSHGLD